MKSLFAKYKAFSLALTMFVTVPMVAWAACPDRPACKGCGCKGGPGYRAPDGRCVGFKDLVKSCGAFPHVACTFENAPGTGANKECALAHKKKKNAPEKARSEEQDPDNPDHLDYEDDEE